MDLYIAEGGEWVHSWIGLALYMYKSPIILNESAAL